MGNPGGGAEWVECPNGTPCPEILSRNKVIESRAKARRKQGIRANGGGSPFGQSEKRLPPLSEPAFSFFSASRLRVSLPAFPTASTRMERGG
ncbi:MAG TPA: hypothetical protein DCE44_23990 [Verrucomicrobiales bacterium]|nr:hypothetical protein [Verrucomicrobiales bacterium]